MSKEAILICICATLFVISLYYVTQNAKLKRWAKDLLNEQIMTEKRLALAEASTPNIVMLRCSKFISKQEMYDFGSNMSLAASRREILKEFSEELGNYVTYHIYDNNTYASVEIVGFLRVIKEDGICETERR